MKLVKLFFFLKTPSECINIIFLNLESKYPVKTKWIAADFSQGIQIYDHIKKELTGIEIGILGNKITL